MQQELGPVYQTLVDLGECGSIVLGQLDALPEFRGEVGALDRLHVEIESTVVATDSGVAGVCERAGLAIAEAGDLGELVSTCILESYSESKGRTLYSFLQKFWPLVVLFRQRR